MAQQEGVISLTGALGNVSFYKSKDGYMARLKKGVDAERIATDPAFQRTRENGAEFARAGKACKLLRKVFGLLHKNIADQRMAGRLTRQMMRVLKADATSARGLRNVIDGETELLYGFEFNIKCGLENVLSAQFTTAISRVTGQLTINIPSFIPRLQIKAPVEATHFRILSAGADINFESEVFNVSQQFTQTLPLNDVATIDFTLENVVPAASTNPLFLVMGIEFFQQVNNSMHRLQNSAYNALTIVQVSGA